MQLNRFISLWSMAVLSAVSFVCTPAHADNRLPRQPKAADGGYIVQWDCSANNGLGDFADANTMQWDETFIFAINLAGTKLGDWVMSAPSDPRRVRSICFHKLTMQDQSWQDVTNRLWHIRDTIFGATYNFKQMPGCPVGNQANGSRLEIRAQIFGFENVLGDKCGAAPTVRGTWWQWPNGWQEGTYVNAQDGQYLFRFAAFTGAHNEPAFDTNGSDDSRNRYVDNGNRISANGYASPWSSASPCPRSYTTDYALNTTTTTVCPIQGQSATISTTGSMAGYTYILYCDDVPVVGSNKAGTGSSLSWTTNLSGTYTVWYYKTAENTTPVMMVPCTGNEQITLTSPASCCNIGGVQMTVSNNNPGMGEEVTVRATITGTNDGNAKNFAWEVHGANGVKGSIPASIIPVSDTISYSEITLSYNDWKAIAGVYEEGQNKNNGWYTFWCYVTEPDHSCQQSGQIQVHVKKELICPTFTWAIDGNEGLATPMYPGGWYDIACTTQAGAPTLTITGTGVNVVNTTTSGNTTTCRVELTGEAAGEIALHAVSPQNENAGYKSCEDDMTPTIAECDGMTKESFKIQWSNFEGWAQYQIHGGANVYLRDNNGYLEADTAHTDGMDEWNIIYTGQKYNNQDSIFYIQNALTQRYLYRGGQHGNNGSGWEYAEALLNATNAQTDDYKWVFYHYNDGKERTVLACLNGYQGNDNNIKNGAYVIHNRNWEEHTKQGNQLFINPDIPSPRMVCGKTGDQGLSSPAFRLKNFIKVQVAASNVSTTLSWNGTAPADSIHMEKDDEVTFTASRTDAVHSINNRIWYESADPTVASVDPATGKVTALVEDGETEIMVILGDTGCFLGDTLRYAVVIYSCGETPAISAEKNTLQKGEASIITLTNPAGTTETGAWMFTQDNGQTGLITTNAGVISFMSNNVGTFKFYYQVTNSAHADCNRQSNELTIEVKEKEDYSLPRQPLAQDGSYIVKWDCAANDFAEANDMEWNETFVFAVNLAGTPLGEWIMRGSGRPGVERSVAFDRFRVKQDESTQFNPDASRLWHIRDTIFGATFNFAQIQYFQSNQFHTPTMGEQTTIAARLFGFETAKGAKCDAAPTGGNLSGKWYEWSNAGTTQSQWNGQWLEGKYVSENDQYLFRFAPYTGTKNGTTIKAKDDDSRDQWWDNHYFDRNGYKMPCPKDWPVDQVLSVDKTKICDEIEENATLTMASSETGWSYVLLKNGVEQTASSTTGTGSALTWTITEAGTYTVQAKATDETSQHSDQMGTCAANKGSLVVGIECPEPECPKVQRVNIEVTMCDTLLPYAWTTYRTLQISKDGTHHDTLTTTLSNGTVCDSIIYTLVLTVEHCERPVPEECEDVVYSKWNDLLFVDNSQNRFVHYQWYCNGQPVIGEDRQFFYREGYILQGDGNTYYCLIGCADGTTVRSCERRFEEFSSSLAAQQQVEERHLVLTPNPTNGATHVRIMGVGDEVQCSIFSAAGRLILQAQSTEVPISLPAGCYMVRVVDDMGQVYSDKLIIR